MSDTLSAPTTLVDILSGARLFRDALADPDSARRPDDKGKDLVASYLIRRAGEPLRDALAGLSPSDLAGLSLSFRSARLSLLKMFGDWAWDHRAANAPEEREEWIVLLYKVIESLGSALALRGEPGRPPKYSREVRDRARALKAKTKPRHTIKDIMCICRDEFPGERLPPNEKAFRAWLGRKPKKLAT